MAADDDDLAKDDNDTADVGVDVDPEAEEASENEFAESDADEITTDLDEFSDEAEILEGEQDGADVEAVVELTSKEQSARSLEIRREIERTMEERRLHEDVDYFDIDLDD